MGLFDRIRTTAAGVGTSLAKGAGHFAGKATLETKESAKIVAVKAELAALEADIETGYLQIGKAYIDACLAGKEVPDFGCGATLKAMEPKLEKKIALEKDLNALEKALADSQALQERALVQAEVDEMKARLDKAKAMGAINDADYEAKLAQINKKLVHFDDIRMLKKQKDLGLLTSGEFDAKVNELLK